MITIQNFVAFLYINNKLSEQESKNKFKLKSHYNKIPGINLN